jgi:hypothetical protein
MEMARRVLRPDPSSQKLKKLDRCHIARRTIRIEQLEAKNVVVVDREKSSDPYASESPQSYMVFGFR